MRELQELARDLLDREEVGVVIGWEEGPRGLRPAFVTDPREAGRLVFDERAVHNLASYLSPRRAHLRSKGRPAVVLKGCDARAVAALIRERQIERNEVVLIGVRCGGVHESPEVSEALSGETVAARCSRCDMREPQLVDHLVGDSAPAPPVNDSRSEAIAEIEAIPADERFRFWREELSRCVRCHACREVCPLCVCERCIADKTDPVWIESSPHLRSAFAWHMTHAMHLAGRCSDCGECERACPVGIPLSLINRKVASVVEERFGHRPTDDPEAPAPIGDFSLDDDQEFIK